VVDDEPGARLAIIRRLELSGQPIDVCGEADNGVDGLALIRDLTPDAVFLDIAMPGLDGLSAARQLDDDDTAPIIVFLTAYGDRALEAFETDAIDYITKPVDPERLARTLDRIVEELHKRRELALSNTLRAAVQRHDDAHGGAEAGSSRVLKLDVGDSIVCVREREITYVEAAGEYACVHTASETLVVRNTLAKFEDEILSERFFRIHRRTLVNVDHVRRSTTKGSSEHTVLLKDGSELAVSRRRTAALRARLKARS